MSTEAKLVTLKLTMSHTAHELSLAIDALEHALHREKALTAEAKKGQPLPSYGSGFQGRDNGTAQDHYARYLAHYDKASTEILHAFRTLCDQCVASPTPSQRQKKHRPAWGLFQFSHQPLAIQLTVFNESAALLEQKVRVQLPFNTYLQKKLQGTLTHCLKRWEERVQERKRLQALWQPPPTLTPETALPHSPSPPDSRSLNEACAVGGFVLLTGAACLLLACVLPHAFFWPITVVVAIGVCLGRVTFGLFVCLSQPAVPPPHARTAPLEGQNGHPGRNPFATQHPALTSIRGLSANEAQTDEDNAQNCFSRSNRER